MHSTVDGSSIKYIIELDKKAREKVAAAKKQAEEIDAQAQSKKNQIIDDYRTNSKNRLDSLEDSCRSDADKRIAEIEAQTKEKTEKFDQAFSRNRKALADRVFEAVTGGKRRK